MKFYSVDDLLPECSLGAFFITGHEWFGIGIWEDGKGWTRGFFGEWPYGDHGHMVTEEENQSFLNESIMYWASIPGDYPYSGGCMGDSELWKERRKSFRDDK